MVFNMFDFYQAFEETDGLFLWLYSYTSEVILEGLVATPSPLGNVDNKNGINLSHKSRNASSYPTMCLFITEKSTPAHIAVTKWFIVG